MNMVFKASPSRIMKAAGLLLSALLLGLGGLMLYTGINSWGQSGGTHGVLIGLGLLMLLSFAGFLFFLPRHYRLTPAELIVWRWGPKVVISLAEIREVRRVKLTKVLKNAGVGGFFGCWGQFSTDDRSNGFGNFTAYLTRNDTEVAVYRKHGEPVVLSPDQPEEFIQAVRERLNSTSSTQL